MLEGLPPAEGVPADPTGDQGAATPPAQPVEQPATPVAAPQQANAALAGRKAPWDNRTYTQATQIASTVRQELGLPNTATPDEVKAALAQLRQGGSGGGQDYLEGLDPAIQEHIIGLEERVWAQEKAIQGPEVVDAARNLFDLARTSSDPMEFVQQFIAAVQAVTSDPSEAALPTEQAPLEAGGQAMPDLGSGDVPLAPQPTDTNPQDATGGRQGTGDLVGWLRSMRAPAGQ